MKSYLLFILSVAMTLSINAQIFQQTAGLSNAGSSEAIFVHEDLVLVAVNEKLFRSEDGGNTFDYIQVDPAGEVTPRCFAMVDDVIVLGGINEDRIYRSTDNGLTWDSACVGCPDIFGFPAAVSIAADTLNGSIFMCGTNFIRKSSDAGLTWEIMDIDGLCLGVSTTNGEVWATPGGNLHKTSDEGATWEDVSDDGLFFSNASIDVLHSEGRIFVTTSLSAGNGLYVSDDGGMSYSPTGDINIGRKLLKIGSNIYLTHLGGFSVSEDNGVTWSTVEGLGGFSTYNGDMAYDGGDVIWLSSAVGVYTYDINSEEVGSAVFPVGTVNEVTLSNNSIYGLQGQQLFQSGDNGTTWDNITDHLDSGNLNVTDVFADGDDIFVLAQLDFNLMYYFSSNDGATFESIPLSGGVSFANQILSYNPVIIASNQGIQVSTDNGVNFTLADLVNLDGSDADDGIQAQAIHQNGSSIFIKGNQGCAYSHDDGASWMYIPLASTAQFAGWEGRLVRNKQAAFPPFTTEESTDGGATWTEIAGLELQFTGPEFMWMMGDSLFIQHDQNTSTPGQIYYLSENMSEWALADWLGAIPNQIISAEQDVDGRIILGTRGGAAWILAEDLPDSIMEESLEQLTVFPNPATDVLLLGHQLSRALKAGAVLELYDSSGKEIEVRLLSPNRLDITAIKSGNYVLILTDGHNRKSVQFMKR